MTVDWKLKRVQFKLEVSDTSANRRGAELITTMDTTSDFSPYRADGKLVSDVVNATESGGGNSLTVGSSTALSAS